jgi:glycosyltransferase involved in cell wall biosynthesis
VAVLPAIDLLAGVSGWLNSQLPRWARARAQVLPCGVDVERFHPIARADARARLGLDPASPYVLFPADPARPEKRFDRARQLCDAVGARLLALGAVSPDSVPLWVNAADAVVVPSEREGFGLAVLEALACEVPVLATPVGIHAEALSGVEGSLCAPFDLSRWREALQAHLSPPPPVPDDSSREAPGGASRGPDAPQARASAMRFSAQRMAQRVADAWHAALRHAG